MTDYDEYAKIIDGRIVVRYSKQDQWGRFGWPPRLAREYALRIAELADQAEREDPKVLELTAVLNEGPDAEKTDELALRLHQAGYRKKY